MKSRVCFYVYGYPPDYSGATNQAIKVAKQLEKMGHKCIFLTYTHNEKHLDIPADDRFPLVRFLWPKGSSDFVYHRRLLSELIKCPNAFDIIYINGNAGQFWTAFYIVLFAKVFRKKVFMELNMEYEDPLCITGTNFHVCKRWAARKVNAFISLSTAIKKNMLKMHDDVNVISIFNGVDVNRFTPADNSENKNKLRKNLGLPVDAKILVTCGAITKRKGVDFLLDAWSKVVSAYDKCAFIFLGPFDPSEDCFTKQYIKKVLAMVKEDRFKNTVVFKGNVSNVEDYFRAADVFGFAGRQEGSPNVLREAMAAGLPIVSLELKDITSDMISNGESGIIIEVKDQKRLSKWREQDISDPALISEFASSITKLFNDEKLSGRFAVNARKTAVSKFSLESQVQQLISAFETYG